MLKFAKEYPTRNGWYWIAPGAMPGSTQQQLSNERPYIIFVKIIGGKLYAQIDGDPATPVPDPTEEDHILWAGPIPQPPQPDRNLTI